MTIEELYNKVKGLPEMVNIIDAQDKHLIDKIQNISPELLSREFKVAQLHHLDSSDYRQIIFYI